jgi:ketosteroid isomerase-like protein
MSAHADTVRQAYEAFKAQDAEALIAVSDPEVEFGGSAAAPDHLYRGHDGIRKYVDDIDGAFGHEWHADLERVADAGEDRVLLVARIHGPGMGGLPLDLRVAHVWELRDGKLYRGRVYVPAEDALRAVGVEP